MLYRGLVIEKFLAYIYLLCVLFFIIADVGKVLETYTFQWRLLYDLVCLWPSFLWVGISTENLETFYDY